MSRMGRIGRYAESRLARHQPWLVLHALAGSHPGSVSAYGVKARALSREVSKATVASYLPPGTKAYSLGYAGRWGFGQQVWIGFVVQHHLDHCIVLTYHGRSGYSRTRSRGLFLAEICSGRVVDFGEVGRLTPVLP